MPPQTYKRIFGKYSSPSSILGYEGEAFIVSTNPFFDNPTIILKKSDDISGVFK
ncbi:MAG: hypothetical protein ACI9XO_000817 [Paraglaciecola sp.]|jgi:hypothetical protein